MGSLHALRRIASRRTFQSRWEIGDVRYEVQGGKYMLALRFSGFDPKATSAERIGPVFTRQVQASKSCFDAGVR